MSFIRLPPHPPTTSAGSSDLRQAAAGGHPGEAGLQPAEENAASPFCLRRCQHQGDLKCRTTGTAHFVPLDARPLEREEKEEEKGEEKRRSLPRPSPKTSEALRLRAPEQRSDVIHQSQEGQGDHSGL